MSTIATTGFFTQENLPSLLKRLLDSYHTGRLFLESGESHGLISFKDGSIIDATMGSQFGESALISALKIVSGKYTFRETSPSGRITIDESLEVILSKVGYTHSTTALQPTEPMSPQARPEGSGLVSSRLFDDLHQALVAALGPIAAVLAEDVTRQMGYQERQLEPSRLDEFAALLLESVPARKRAELEQPIRNIINRHKADQR